MFDNQLLIIITKIVTSEEGSSNQKSTKRNRRTRFSLPRQRRQKLGVVRIYIVYITNQLSEDSTGKYVSPGRIPKEGLNLVRWFVFVIREMNRAG